MFRRVINASLSPYTDDPADEEADYIVHKDKDLRIPNTTPEQLAKVLLRGGAKPRPETKKKTG